MSLGDAASAALVSSQAVSTSIDAQVPPTADVVVVGGGPAGSAAAIELTRAGRSVILIDRATFPRDKCCGDGLTTLALRELEAIGFDHHSVADWFDVDGATLRSPSGRTVEVPLVGPGRFAAVAPRRQLDNSLIELARQAGALVLDGTAFEGISVAATATGGGADSVVVATSRGSISTRYVVAADGMWSPVRKALGLHQPGYLGEWHGFRQYVSNVTGPAAEQLFVWFEDDLLPGYAWSFPLPGGRVNLGFGVLRSDRDATKQMASTWRDLLTRPHIVEALGADFELEDRHTAWPIPARIDQATLTADRVLFVGDAAMATDVMTGEGIGQALLTGRLAAEAIDAGGALQPDVVASLYRAEVAHHLRADHKMSAALGRVLASSRGARGAIRVVAASGDWGRRNFARWMFEDEPRAVMLTPSRWHRQLLRRPGAAV